MLMSMNVRTKGATYRRPEANTKEAEEPKKKK